MITLKGKIIRKILNVKSKSEHNGFIIQTNNGDFIINKEGDNPFENETLCLFDGYNVSADGDMYNGKFIANNIEKE